MECILCRISKSKYNVKAKALDGERYNFKGLCDECLNKHVLNHVRTFEKIKIKQLDKKLKKFIKWFLK